MPLSNSEAWAAVLANQDAILEVVMKRSGMAPTERDDFLQEALLFCHQKALVFDAARMPLRWWIKMNAKHFMQAVYTVRKRVRSHLFDEREVGAPTWEPLPPDQYAIASQTVQRARATLSARDFEWLSYWANGETVSSISTKTNYTRQHIGRTLDKAVISLDGVRVSKPPTSTVCKNGHTKKPGSVCLLCRRANRKRLHENKKLAAAG